MFIKKNISNSQIKQSIEYKKGVPSYINKQFKLKRIDAAFISSIESKRGNFKCFDLGIIAKEEIKSVILKRGKDISDSDSATSNALAKQLNLKGEVIIGDKALKAYLQNPDDYIDLAKQWHKKHNLPFVFARLCANSNHCYYKKLSRKFLNSKQFIPRYILLKYVKSRNILEKDIISYLKLVHYDIDAKSKKSLKKFLS
jgi:chorismate dehydratase